MPVNYRKILVIRLSSLGDIVLLVPALLRLRSAASDAEVHLLTKRRYAGIFEGSRFVDRIVALERGDAAELVRLGARLAGERYDAVIDAHGVLRSTLLFHALRARRKIRIEKSELKKFLLIAGKLNLYRGIATQADRYHRLVDALGVDQRSRGDGALPLPPPAREAAEAALGDRGRGSERLVAFAPGARWDTKRWPRESFVEIMARTGRLGYGTVLVGGAADTELAAAIAGAVSPPPLNLSGKLSILESAAVLARCAALVTNDSAPLHLAEAVGTPVVAFFGPTVREFGYFPRLSGSVALETTLGCRPCSRNGARSCPYGTKECLTAIPPARAFEALSGVLAKGEATA